MSSSDDDLDSVSSSILNSFKAKHKCTDVPCTVLFVTSVVAFCGVFAWAVAVGDTRKLTNGLDYQGRICGMSEGVADKPFLYYCPKEFTDSLRILVIDRRHPVCVPSCPSGTFDRDANETHVTPAAVPECPTAVTRAYLAAPFAGLYCLPQKYYSASAIRDVHDAVNNVLDTLASSLHDAVKAWPLMVFAVVAATILGYIYLWFLRMTARFLIWLCVAVSVAILVGLGVYLWTTDLAIEVSDDMDSDEQIQTWAVLAKSVLAVVLWVLAFLVLCLACCCGGSMKLSTACVQRGSLVIWKMPLMLLAPLEKAFTKSILALIFIWGFMRLWATGEVAGTGLHREYSHSPEQWALIVFYIYGAYWILSFWTALYDFRIAYAVAKYYKTKEDEDGDRDIDACAITEGLTVGLGKHAGSLAYGAAIIAALELAQRVLEYAQRKNKELGEDANRCVQCMLKSCLCCCRCMEGIIAYINKTVYIDIAVSGDDNFCEAVRNVMHVIIDFGPAMAILNGATVIFQIVGLASITAVVGLLTGIVLTRSGFSDPTSRWLVSNPTVPIAVACFIAFTVAWAFMAIFDMTTDTLLYCYAEDKRENDGTAINAPADMRTLYERAEAEAERKRNKAAGSRE